MILDCNGNPIDVEPARERPPSAAQERETLEQMRKFQLLVSRLPPLTAKEFTALYADYFYRVRVNA